MLDESFAEELDALRHHAGLSLRALVRSSGVPRSTLSDALSGRRSPSLETVLAVVRACGADPDPWRRRWAEMTRQRRHHQALSAPGERMAVPVPAQLPYDVPGFASRESELAQLGAGITVIHGRPGVGKTALAVHWAHRAAGSYPDGQLFVNLRGHHPALGPVPPIEALGWLLGSFGVRWVPASQAPDDGAALWRSVAAGRRIVIVLDDAASADQVRPLLPGAPGCTVLVTSRHYLADLVVRDGADGLMLDVLPAGSSLALLGQVAGRARVAAEPQAAAAVAAACGHLPLALRMAGAVLAGAPQRRFADLVEELNTGDRLTALEGLARPSAVETAFELSYRLLTRDAGVLFRRLGLHPGPDIGEQAAAALAGLDGDTVRLSLSALAEAHLVEPARAGRYRMHDLLHDYAARLAGKLDTEPERDAARRRLFDWYLDRALAVSARLKKGAERLLVPDLPSSWAPTNQEATAWLEAEHANILALISDDARRGTGAYAWALIDLVAVTLSRRRDVSGLIVATDAGLAAAQREADRRAEGVMCLRRGWLRARGGQGDGAAADFARARQVWHEVGVRRGEASALVGLATSHAETGRLDEARRDAEAALAIYRAEDDQFGQAATLNNLAIITGRAADLATATGHLEQALALLRRLGSGGDVAVALGNLAHLHIMRGAFGQALACAEEAVALARDVGDGVSEVLGLNGGARAYEQAGALDQAHRWAEAAAAAARRIKYRFGEALALNTLATTTLRLGLPETHRHRSRALRLIRAVGDLATEADVLVGVAHDAYQTAVDSPPPADHALRTARKAAQRAVDAGVVADSPYAQAAAMSLLASCDLGLGKVTDAVAAAHQAVEMHASSGARVAEAAARCVLARALSQDDDPAGARAEWRIAARILDDLAMPPEAPVRRLLDQADTGRLPSSA